jgi:hypothetical protein
MKSTISKEEVHAMTVEAAYDYASSLVEMEARGSDNEAAMARLEQRYGLSPNQIMHLRSRRAKSCDVSLFARLRLAYIDLCESQVRKLQHQIAIERATSDAFDEDIAREVRELAAKVAAKKSGLRLASQPSKDGGE